MSKEDTGTEIETRDGIGSAYVVDGGTMTVGGFVTDEARG